MIHLVWQVGDVVYFKEVELVSMSTSNSSDKPTLNINLQDSEHRYEITIAHKDLHLIRYLQSKFASTSIVGERKIDVVHQLAKWLSLAEIQELSVKTSADCDLAPLIALVAMREEPSKVKWLQMPTLGDTIQKNQSNRYHGGKK